MAAPDPYSLGVPRPQFPRLRPACLPRYPLQTILRQVLVTASFIYPSGRADPDRYSAGSIRPTACPLRRCNPGVDEHVFRLGHEVTRQGPDALARLRRDETTGFPWPTRRLHIANAAARARIR